MSIKSKVFAAAAEGAPTEAGQEGVVTAIVLRGTCRWNHPGKKKAPR